MERLRDVLGEKIGEDVEKNCSSKCFRDTIVKFDKFRDTEIKNNGRENLMKVLITHRVAHWN